MLKPVWIIGFTGHRRLDESPLVAKAIESQLSSLSDEAERRGGEIHLFSSVAIGSDMMAVETAIRMGIPCHLVLPVPQEEFRKDFLQEEDWHRACRLIEIADRGDGGCTLRVADCSDKRPECYYEAGIQIVAGCDVLLAVWNGEESRGLGGTAEIVEHAAALDLQLRLIDPETGIVKEDNASAFAPDTPTNELFDEIKRDCLKGTETCAESIYRPINDAAMADSRIFRNNVCKVITFHGVASILAAMVIFHEAQHSQAWWPLFITVTAAVELCLIGQAVWLTRRIHHGQVHQRWVRNRLAAEIVRGIQHSAGLVDPMFPRVNAFSPEWRRFAVSVSLREWSSLPDRDVATLQRKYLSERLIGQIEHFETRGASSMKVASLTTQISIWAGRLALVFVIGALIYKASHLIPATAHPLAHGAEASHAVTGSEGTPAFPLMATTLAFLFLFLPIALPLTAGLASSFRMSLDSSRRSVRYPEMAGRLRAISRGFGALRTPLVVSRSVQDTEDVMLHELFEWALTERQNGTH